ncbi:MAG: DinB family protein [Anaerolineae bacterium]|nr:DinB family protein [Anaerolineae bacterium]
MTTPTLKDHLVEALLMTLEETFEQVHGIYLDKGTALFETLATISAEEASRPVSPTCATLAAQVEHTWFYLEMTIAFARGTAPEKVDWNHIWQTVSAVTPAEWEASIARLRDTYAAVIQLVKTYPAWEQADAQVIGSAIGMVIHTAYHLGEIRHALCTLRA